ncbi:NACHT domain-containing protein [Clostridium gasigenes]|uniref:NACHT domain-containing protein n=1 Tax=Clostridium gasigenes TaxID=94869 RepID=UPI001C0DE4CE|nr:NACHT domain-containing protein [Clostridium gasigenes]MBU3105148.1 NACHT domain-containing protein [Clostridium gasigenes]
MVGLCNIIIKTVIRIWFKDENLAIETGIALADIIMGKISDRSSARHIGRDFEIIEDSIYENLEVEFEYMAILKENSKKAILEEVKTVLQKSNITHKKILDFNYDTDKLYKHILSENESYKKYFESDEIELYKKVLKFSIQYTICISEKMPEFQINNYREMFNRFDDIKQKILGMLNELQTMVTTINNNTNKNIVNKNIEEKYRRLVARKYNKINLFGSNLDRNMKYYELSVAYVSLEVSLESSENFGDEYENIISLEKAFEQSKVVSIIGEAGSGKTTLLQWLAVKTATGKIEEEIPALQGYIPFIIELRKVKEWPINIGEFINNSIKDLNFTIPNEWYSDVLENRKILLLVDGLDEIDKKMRESVLIWIEEIIDLYNIRVVITSRPSANERLNCNSLDLNILQMTYRNIENFIEYWHKAVLQDQGLENREDIFIIKKKLMSRINNSSPIHNLAKNPLLCAMLCALHYKNNLNLPSDRNELYEGCCKMLLDSRDSERDINMYNNINMSYRQKRVILDNLAYWMVKNERVTIEIREFENYIYKKIENMNILTDEVSADDIIQYLIERSGIIRESEVGVIDFIHKTFQEYMAATQASNEGDWGLLAHNANEDSWTEIIIIATSFANIKYADNLIGELLKKAKIDGINKINYQFLAIACSRSAIEISAHIRLATNNIIASLIPPKIEDRRRIALAGELAIPYLNDSKDYKISEKIACLKVLEDIGDKSILGAIKTYINVNMDKLVWIEIINVLKGIPIKNIKDSGLSKIIIDYIPNIIGNGYLKTNQVIWNIICSDKSEFVENEIISKVRSLSIENYIYDDNKFQFEIIENLESLYIKGDIKNLDFINNVSKLKTLSLLGYGKEFDLNSIANYRQFKYLKSLEVEIGSQDYIQFDNLKNLNSLDTLILHFNDIPKYLKFEDMKGLNKLETIELNGKYIFDIELDGISKLNQLKKLILAVRSEFLPENVMCFQELEFLKEIVIKSDIIDEKYNEFSRNLRMCLPNCNIIRGDILK